MTVIAQLRNNFLFDSLDDYNCSLASPPVDWTTRGTPRPVFGSLCIASCLVGVLPYLACLPTLWGMRSHACYKMMFFLGLTDMGTLVGLALGGVTFVLGGVYCHAPRISYAVGLLTCGSFFASCCACFMIAINRFVELFDIRSLLALYKGNRPWLVMVIPCLYGYIPMMVSPIATANSEAHLFLIDPLIFSDDRYEYTSYFLLGNNFTMPSMSSLLYLTMTCGMFVRRRTVSKEQHTSAQRATIMLSIQCGIIVIFHMTTMLGYAFLQLIHTSDALQYAAHMSWIFMHGLPPYIYFTFNSAVRMRLLGIAPSQAMRVTTTMNNSVGKS